MCKSINKLVTDYNLHVEKIEKIIALTTRKNRKVTLMFNNTLWTLFQGACKKDGRTATGNLEMMIIKFIEEKGLL